VALREAPTDVDDLLARGQRLLMTAEVGEADADVARARREYVRGDSIRVALRDAPKDIDGLLARRQCLLAAAEAKEAIAKVAQAPSEISEDGDLLIAQREGTDAWSEEDAVDRMLGPLPGARILFFKSAITLSLPTICWVRSTASSRSANV
jgi:hypothetical protein